MELTTNVLNILIGFGISTLSYVIYISINYILQIEKDKMNRRYERVKETLHLIDNIIKNIKQIINNYENGNITWINMKSEMFMNIHYIKDDDLRERIEKIIDDEKTERPEKYKKIWLEIFKKQSNVEERLNRMNKTIKEMIRDKTY